MKKRTLQIDVTGFNKDIAMVECKVIIDGRSCFFYTSKANYEALTLDGVFIRDGKVKDSANILNTTRLFDERS